MSILKLILTLFCDIIQITFNGGDRIAEVRYFTRLARDLVDGRLDPDEERNAQDRLQFIDVALVTLYSNPHPHLLEWSYGVLASCTKLGEESLQIIKITDIRSVVTMIPHRPVMDGVAEDRYFLAEKTGMDIARFGLENEDD